MLRIRTPSAIGFESIIRVFQLTTALRCLILFIATIAFIVPSAAQSRLLGLDISAWQGNISQTTWNNIRTNDNRQFIILRSSRGGTTGVYNQNYPNNNFGTNTLSQRYDDPYYVQNMNRVPAAGMYAGSYHFSRPDIIAATTNSAGIPNSGTDEADHFIQMAGPWMRPGYLVPVHDLEAGDGIRTDDEMAQFTIDFSSRIYSVMGIRPAIYINGNYAAFILGTASASLRNQLAQPSTNPPTPVSPAAPQLWSARWPNQADPNSIDVQNGEPKDTYAAIYGPWDDYGTTHPWTFWQYASTLTIPSFSGSLDADVVHGGVEFLKDQLIPAVWMIDANGDWSTLTNWNSGKTPVAPVTGSGQVAPVGTQTLPTPRLPGAAGSGTTSGQHDTVILERPNTNITVTLSTGTHNIRKLYMRETLNITGGSLAVNFAPSTDSTTNGAEFSGPVTLSGSANFSVHTLQVDDPFVFTLNGGTITLNTIALMPGTTPAKIAFTGNVAVNALSNITAVIKSGSGSGSAGFVDFSGTTRTLTVGDGTSEVDLSLDTVATNGGLTKSGLGTLRLNAANTYASGTTVSAGRLLVNNTTNSGTGSGGVTVSGGFLGGTGTIAGNVLVNSGATIAPGSASTFGKLTLGSVPTFNGTNFTRINRNGGSPLSDQLALSSGTLNYSGALVVSNAGAALIGGEVFTNFSASSYAGSFATSTLPTFITAGLNWHLGNLTVNGTIKVNRQPTANADTFTNTPSGVLQIPFANLTPNDTDPDADSLTVSGITLTTTNGITLITNGTFITYSNTLNVSDRFSYVISDGSGGSATNFVYIVASPVVNVPPSISAQPLSQIVKLGSNVTFNVTASGTPSPAYQWRFNNADIFGATATSFIRSNAQFADAGNYSVFITNVAGNITSSNASLTVLPLAPLWMQSITPLPDGRMTLVVTGEPGYTFAVERTTNFSIWQEITNMPNPTGSSSVTDHSASSNANGFYRARQ